MYFSLISGVLLAEFEDIEASIAVRFDVVFRIVL